MGCRSTTSRRLPWSAGPAAVGFALLALAAQARAHPFLEPYDLPLPLLHYLTGAGAVVLLSFLGAALLGRRPSQPRQMSVPLPARPAALVVAGLRTLSVMALATLLLVGFLGEQGDWGSNLLPMVVWVVWWVGLAFLCALLGDVWALIDPWRSVGLAVAALGRCWRGGGLLHHRRSPPLRLPERAGVWPAVLLFLAFAFVLLVWPSNAVPARLAGLVLAYSLLAWSVMALFGVQVWLRSFDPFSLYFGLFARFAPMAGGRDEAGRPRLLLRSYGAGLAQAELPSWSLVAFVLTVLAVLGFDGFSETPAWSRTVGAAVAWLYEAGLVERVGFVAAQSLVKTAGLLSFPLIFAAVYLAVCGLCARLGRLGVSTVARGYALSLVPIAIGVHLAHDFALLAAQVGTIAPSGAGPLGFGWDLPWAGDRLDPGPMRMGTVWAVAVAGVVLGHSAAVWSAHRASVRLALTTGAQLPMVVLMVAYTVASLWVLSQPIVR